MWVSNLRFGFCLWFKYLEVWVLGFWSILVLVGIFSPFDSFMTYRGFRACKGPLFKAPCKIPLYLGSYRSMTCGQLPAIDLKRSELWWFLGVFYTYGRHSHLRLLKYLLHQSLSLFHLLLCRASPKYLIRMSPTHVKLLAKRI